MKCSLKAAPQKQPLFQSINITCEFSINQTGLLYSDVACSKESGADHFEGRCVQFHRDFFKFFFFSQLEERHLITFSLKSALHAGQVGKEKAVNIQLSVPLCGSWQHSPLCLHYRWITKSLVMFFCPSPFSHTEIRLHTS